MNANRRSPLRILIVNDSATMRLALSRALREEDPAIVVVGEVNNGAEALAAVREHEPDVILMDIVMPGVDGYTATREVMAAAPTPIVLYSSVVSVRDVAVAMEALRSGALAVADALPAPSDPNFVARRSALAQLLRAMSNVDLGKRKASAQRVARPTRPGLRVSIIGVASSTGGPQALHDMLRGLPLRSLPPILIVQHIARGFTDGFARWLNESTGHSVRVAVDGEVVSGGVVYVGAEDRQLGVDANGRLVVRADPHVGVFRPSATYLFRALARAYGARAAGIVLTGMGNDGAAGLAELRAAGGVTAVQDEASSVVHGMPRAAIDAGADPDILPLDGIAAWILEASRK